MSSIYHHRRPSLFPYFTLFPQITYANSVTIDLSKRVGLFNSKLGPNYYAPYQVQPGVRADILANQIYGDPNVDWLLYLSNNIVDPYYGWTLSDVDFNQF